MLLEAGFYIVEETEADLPADSPVSMPSDVKDTYRVIEVEAGKTASEAVFNNPAVYGKFIFKKVDQNGKLITGTDVKFKLYRQAADGQSWEQGQAVKSRLPRQGRESMNQVSCRRAIISLWKRQHRDIPFSTEKIIRWPLALKEEKSQALLQEMTYLPQKPDWISRLC